MKASLTFGLVVLVLTAAAGAVLLLFWRDPDDRRAIAISAAIAVAVQVIGFVVARRSLGKNVMVGWGIGMLIRFASLALYAFLVVGALGLPSSPALISLATFFFLTTLVEPLLLKP